MALTCLVCACGPDIDWDDPVDDPDTPSTDPVEPGGDGEDEKDGEDGKHSAKDGIAYLYDGACVPSIHISVSLKEWNRLLTAYDRDSNTKEQVVCAVTYDKAGEQTKIDSASIRLRGNTSRRRPEGSSGKMHSTDNTNWHHCHFQLNFHKYVKDDAHEVHGARKVVLKWFKDDPCYVRELYCYDLFRRVGVWTASNAAYCRLYIQVEGDTNEAYFGVYEMIEPIDERFLKVRKDEFGSKDGFLWKCRWGASLSDANADMGADLGDGVDHCYELKTHTDSLDIAKAQLQDFILKLTGKGDESFYAWIPRVCDVQLLLRTYAVNVVVGMWDDYWNNRNNYYLYFNSHDKFDYKFYLLPFDYDNTLGTMVNCGVQSDAGRQDPYNWGDNSNLLIYRILKNSEFREFYRQELLRLVSPEAGLFYYESSIARINAWQSSISAYVSNDTGEDMSISDSPASWSTHKEYRLLDTGVNNFFKVKTSSIHSYCD